MTKNYNENDPLKAQKRLFGTLKNIVNKTENFFEEGDDGFDYSSKKTQDPAYKYINKQNWKSLLNEEEKEYLRRHPSPLFESESAFHQRFSAHKKFKQKQTDQLNGSNEEFEENKPVLSSKNKKENMTNLICSECGYPLNDQEDVYCPECGCKIIYPTNEVKTKTIEIQNSTKGNEYLKGKVTETENLIQEESLVSETEGSIQEESIVSETENSIQEESLVSNKEIKDQPISQNNLPIDILIDLKSFFEEKLINEIEYNQLRKLALKISKDPKLKGDLSKIKLISREKLSELRNLFNEQLIAKDEYDDLRKNLIEIL